METVAEIESDHFAYESFANRIGRIRYISTFKSVLICPLVEHTCYYTSIGIIYLVYICMGQFLIHPLLVYYSTIFRSVMLSPNSDTLVMHCIDQFN